MNHKFCQFVTYLATLVHPPHGTRSAFLSIMEGLFFNHGVHYLLIRRWSFKFQHICLSFLQYYSKKLFTNNVCVPPFMSTLACVCVLHSVFMCWTYKGKLYSLFCETTLLYCLDLQWLRSELQGRVQIGQDGKSCMTGVWIPYRIFVSLDYSVELSCRPATM